MWLLSSLGVALGIALLFVLPAALSNAVARDALTRTGVISTYRSVAIMVVLLGAVSAITLTLPDDLNFGSLFAYTYFAGGPPLAIRATVVIVLFAVVLVAARTGYRRMRTL
jgi:uncharacterized membrane protein